MSLYYFLDFMLFTLIIFLSVYAYQAGIYQKLFEYFKLFLLISISGKFASFSGIQLQKIHFLSADSYAIIILFGFCLNLIIFYYVFTYILLFLDKYINSHAIKQSAAKMVTVIEVLLIVTFIYYMFMQLTPSKKYLYPFAKKSFSYPYIKQFYMKFLNDDFVYMILNSDTGTNHKEVIFKSLKNSL